MSQWFCNVIQACVYDQIAAGNGEKTAIIDDHGETSYARLLAELSRVGNGLRDRRIGFGDRVVVALPDGVPFAATLFGALAIGAIPVMVDPQSKEIDAIAERIGATLIVGHVTTPGTSFAELVSGMSETIDVYPTTSDDDAIWLFSGGTTGGRPKIVRQRHGSYVAVMHYLARDFMGYTETDRTLSVPRLFFGYATGGNLLFPLAVGGTAVLKSAWPTEEKVFAQIMRYRPTIVINTPAMVSRMLDYAAAHPTEVDLSSVRFMTSAGEKLPDSVYLRWVVQFPDVPLCDGLGFAEHWYFVSWNRPQMIAVCTAGEVIPGLQVKICAEDGQELPLGDVGELWVTGPAMARGYFNDEEATAAAFRGGWFVGGDLARLTSHGGAIYLTHMGRVANTFKVNGRWVYPDQVVDVLLTHPAVGECAVIARTDDGGVTKPMAFIVLKSENGVIPAVDISTLAALVLGGLGSHQCPRFWRFLQEPLPRTHLGKVDLQALRAMT